MTDAAIHVLGWYLALAAAGAAALLPAALIGERLHTGGVLYARPLGLAIVALCCWLVAWFGWAPYGTPLASGALVLLAAWSASLAWRRRDLVRLVWSRRGTLLAGEALCAAVFALVLLARAQAPEATATEKPMDLMLIAAVHEAGRMPPPDPWLAGHALSYYHLGHLGADVLGRLSGNAPGVTFNLITATAGALAAVGVAGLAADAMTLGGRAASRRALLAGGGVAVVTLLLVTPLVGLVNLAAANGIGDRAWWAALGVEGVPVAAGAQAGVPTAFWWWWPSTRVLPETINEFPAFTLLLGDPHAHLLALPLDLVAVALALVTFEGGAPLTWRRWTREPERLALTGIVFAAIFMTNAWDVVVYGGIWGVAALLAYLRTGWSLLPALVGVARWALPPAGLALLLAAGFMESLDPPRLGLAPVTGEHSDPVRWLLVWLPPLLPAAAALAMLRPRVDAASTARALSFALTPLAGWAGLLIAAGQIEELASRGLGWTVIAALVTTIAILAGAAMHADRAAERGPDRALSAALALLGAALVVLLATELFRVTDAFPGRLNTVFKFWFNAWAVLAVAAGALAGLAWERGTLPRRALPREVVGYGVPLALAAAFATSLYVPAMAVSRAREGQTPGLDGVAYLQRADPGLYATIEWVRGHLDPSRDVVAQALVDSYTAGGTLSVVTGVPALLNWPNHERQWRSAVPETERRAALQAIYAGGATPATAEVARRLGVTYVYVGREERAAYGGDVARRFAGWPAVVDRDGALLVRVPAAGEGR